MLKQGGATTRATVPVSAGLLADTDSYFTALTDYRNGDPSPIVTRFADAALAAIGNVRLLKDLLAIYKAWSESITARRTATVWRVLPKLLSQPAGVQRYVVWVATDVTQALDDFVDRARRRH